MRSMAKSQELQAGAERLFPGGVNSPVRAFRAVGGHPPFVARAEGAYLFDADGNRYVDLFGSCPGLTASPACLRPPRWQRAMSATLPPTSRMALPPEAIRRRSYRRR